MTGNLRKCVRLIVCVLSIALLLSTFTTPVFSSQAGPAPAGLETGSYEILMISRQFVPESGIGREDREALQVLGAQALATGRHRIHALVQLEYIPTQAEKDALARQGVILLEYIPNYAWIAAIPAGNPGQVARLAGVRWVGNLAAADKTDSALSPEASPWAYDADNDLTALYVVLHRDVPEKAGRAFLAEFGEVKSYAASANLYVVWLKPARIAGLLEQDPVSWVQPPEPKWEAINSVARDRVDSEVLDGASYGNADGTNVDILIYDGGWVRTTHQELTGRVTQRGSCALSDHSTHVACTTSASGVTANAIGMSNNMHALLSDCVSGTSGAFLYTDPGNVESALDYAKDTWSPSGGDADGAELFNASVGTNTAPNGFPCAWEGNYGPTDTIVDNMVRGDTASAGKFIAVWANGNERSSGACGTTYHTTAPPACGKNAIHVGATNKDADTMTSFSSWGPCDDGRIKPVISAPGCATSGYIYSCASTGNTAYTNMCGTSMASPVTAGVVGQLIEYCRAQGLSYCPTDGEFWPSSAKALLMHAAIDLGNTGPDYQYGYGRIEADATADLITHNPGGGNYADFRQSTISDQAEIESYQITVSGSPAQLKVSLAWDDEAATMQSLKKLVNDLDLEVVSPGGTTYRPYILDPNNPANAATTGVDSINNQEQVIVSSPANGTWTIRVVGTTVPAGPQDYSVVFPNAYNTSPTETPGAPAPVSPAPNPSFCAGYITNGGFESGATGWNPSGSAAQSNTYAYADTYSMRAGGTANGAYYQDIVVPATMFYGTLSFWYRMQTSETTHPWDFFDVEVRNTSNQALTTLLSTDDSKSNGVWTQASFAIGPEYAGQTIRLHFSADVDSSVNTYWYVDEVSASLCSNTAPTLNTSGSPYLAAINEDDTTNSGTLVSSIIASALPLDMITDPDAGAVEGLAIIGVDSANGDWEYSTNNGSSWNSLGAPTDRIARLLASDANNRIRFVPDTNWNGTVAAGITFRAWDQAAGVNGGTADTASNGGSTSFSAATETASITVNPVNDAPVLDPIGDRSVDEGSLLSFTAAASDPDVPADELSFSLDVGAPGGASINAATGEFTWTPGESEGPGEYPVTVRVTDDGTPALDDAETITITVNEVNTAPALGLVGDKNVDELATLVFTATATDGDIPTNTLTFLLDAAPAGASIDPVTGEFTWAPTEADGPGEYTATVRVSDGELEDAETITITVAEINVAPVLASIGNKSIMSGTLLSLTAMASDADLPANALIFSLDAGAPAGATINPASGVFTWTPAITGEYPITIRVTDDGSPALDDAETITVTVTALPPNVAPVLDGIGDKEVDELATLVFTATAADANGDSLTYSLDPGSAGAIHAATGAYTWTPTEADGPGEYTATVRVSDGELEDAETITITVDEINVAPVLASIGNKSVLSGTLLSLTATASDADLPANALTFSLDAGAPAGASIDSDTGAFTWTPVMTGEYPITVRVTDDGEPVLDDAETITVTVTTTPPPNVAPVLDGIGDKEVDELATLVFTATATDANGDSLTYSLDPGSAGTIHAATGEFTWAPTEADGPGEYTATVRVSDGELEDAETITITVAEINVAPVLASIGNKSVMSGTLLSLTAMASDADLPANALIFSLDAGAPAGASIDGGTGAFTWTPVMTGEYPITVRVTDDGEPVLDDAETITVTVTTTPPPNVAPVLDGIGDKEVDELATLVFTATAADANGDSLTYSLDPGSAGTIHAATGAYTWTPTEADGPGEYTATVRVSDGELEDAETITITVTEVNVAPVLGAIGDKSVDAGKLLSFTVTATDADAPANMLSFSLDAGAPSGAIIDTGTGVFSWTPTQAQAGDVYTITIRVTDNGSPVLDDSETSRITVNPAVYKIYLPVVTRNH